MQFRCLRLCFSNRRSKSTNVKTCTIAQEAPPEKTSFILLETPSTDLNLDSMNDSSLICLCLRRNDPAESLSMQTIQCHMDSDIFREASSNLMANLQSKSHSEPSILWSSSMSSPWLPGICSPLISFAARRKRHPRSLFLRHPPLDHRCLVPLTLHCVIIIRSSWTNHFQLFLSGFLICVFYLRPLTQNTPNLCAPLSLRPRPRLTRD